MMFVDEINADIVRWAGPDHNPKNIRALLQSFHTVWKHDTDKWQPLGFQDLLNGAQCRKAFRKGAGSVPATPLFLTLPHICPSAADRHAHRHNQLYACARC
jgi:hypothetical protein